MSKFKYKIVWSHDGHTETFYALNEKDAKEIQKSIMSAVSYGMYKENDVKIEKIEQE